MVKGFGFRVSGVLFRVSGVEFRVSGLGSRVSGAGSRVSGLGSRGEGRCKATWKRKFRVAGNREEALEALGDVALHVPRMEYHMTPGGCLGFEVGG